jgi:hypothetical protein
MFSIRDRDRIRDRVLQLAASDARVVAGDEQTAPHIHAELFA